MHSIPGDKKMHWNRSRQFSAYTPTVEIINNKSPVRPMVGVSRCLLGDAVRYDGEAKSNTIILENLSQQFELIPVCPEVEAGLGVPRPPVRLTTSIENPILTGRDDPTLDVTAILDSYCKRKSTELNQLSGFIFKSRSPSCGLNSTPVFIDNECVTETSRGVFARSLCANYPDLAVIEDTELENRDRLEWFIQHILHKQSS
jgi:uncharacterized protein YbbK (DUF523 family)